MKVTLLAHTPDPEKLVATAAKLCYSSSNIEGIGDGLSREKVEDFIGRLMGMGHESPVEHCTFTFGVEGVSRALLAQLTRHRIASYSVKSQRYVSEKQFDYVIPPEIDKDPKAKALYIHTMEQLQAKYEELAALLKTNHIKAGMDPSAAQKKANEDARFVLPNACETQLIMTFNVRSLFNFFHHRCCERAQWEIRALADEMLRLVKEVAPVLFRFAGPSCLKGACPEGKMSCGKMAEKRKQYLC
jgi:thymidylate synthase (FAD)